MAVIKQKPRVKIPAPAQPAPAKPGIDLVLADRGSKYGSFIAHAQITQDLEDVMRATAKWPVLTASQKECLHMVAHKIGRILNGDPTYVDSWTDIIGYTRLVEKELLGEELL